MGKEKEVELAQLSMLIPATTWKKVGIMAAVSGKHKKVIVEMAIEALYEQHKVKE